MTLPHPCLSRSALATLLVSTALCVPAAYAVADESAARPTTTATAQMCRSCAPWYVNGDGCAEVAVGEPGHRKDSGAVPVFYGSRAGLMTKTTGFGPRRSGVHPSHQVVPGAAGAGHPCGEQTALRDFNGDRCADLAIGAEQVGISGSATVLYGSPKGLTISGNGTQNASTDQGGGGPGSAITSS